MVCYMNDWCPLYGPEKKYLDIPQNILIYVPQKK